MIHNISSSSQDVLSSKVAGATLRAALRKKLQGAVLAGMVCGIAATGSIAQAQVTETSPGEFTASGANSAGQVAAGGNANVVTEEGFSVDAPGETALAISGDGALSYTDEHNSSLSGIVGLDINQNYAEETAGSPSIYVNTGGNISGVTAGINVQSLGYGPIEINASGLVTATDGDGIRVELSEEAFTETPGAITVNANNVTAAGSGIWIETHTRNADVFVTATGNIIGSADSASGVYINTGGDINVELQGDVTAATGVSVGSVETGNIELTTLGTVTGQSGDAISVYSYSQAPATVTVTANNARSEGNFGIMVNRGGAGEVEVNVNGTVEGTIGGILVTGQASTTINVAEGAAVRNLSQDPYNLAIALSTSNGVTINNDGSIIGRIEASGSAGNDTLNNNGLWHTADTDNSFGSGDNTINNNAGGVIKAAADNFTSYTTLSGVNTFVNAGDIDLRNSIEEVEEEEEEITPNMGIFAILLPDNVAGDRLRIGGFEPTGEFRSEGGRLFVDVDFENQVSDVLEVDNVTLGSAPTRVFVTSHSPGAPTTEDGILVVDVAGTSDDAFVLGKPVGRGLYSYELGRGQNEETDQNWYLRSNGDMRGEVPMVSALTVLAGRTSLATLSSPHDRQREGDDSVDYFTRRTGARLVSRAFTLPDDEQVARKGVWGRIIGQNNEFSANGGSRAGYDASLWGAQAGIDLVASGSVADGRTYGGVYLGYASSQGDALRGNTRLGDLGVDAASIGAYYTRYSSNGFYWDATAQYSRLSNAELKYAGDRAKSDGSSYLVSLEAGKQLNRESKYVAELQGQLLYQKTNVDDMRLADSTRFEVGNLSGMTGRVGVRLARNPHQGAGVQPWLRADLWRTFNQDVRVSSLGDSITTPAGGTTGEVQLGFSIVPQKSGSWSAYVAGGYQFDVSGSEYSGWKGTLGVRKGW